MGYCKMGHQNLPPGEKIWGLRTLKRRHEARRGWMSGRLHCSAAWDGWVPRFGRRKMIEWLCVSHKREGREILERESYRFMTSRSQLLACICCYVYGKKLLSRIDEKWEKVDGMKLYVEEGKISLEVIWVAPLFLVSNLISILATLYF